MVGLGDSKLETAKPPRLRSPWSNDFFLAKGTDPYRPTRLHFAPVGLYWLRRTGEHSAAKLAWRRPCHPVFMGPR
jgi:hypothetical protein